jgi:hypothetical protein
VLLRAAEDDVVWREVDGQVLLLDLEGSTYFQLNHSGALLWRRLLDGATEADLAEVLTERYGIDRAQAEGDVRHFLAMLDAKSLVRR